MTRVWLTGAQGMLGLALARELARRDVDCFPTDRELDIADETQVFAFAQRERPSVVINAAGFTQVDLAEAEREVAFRVNGRGAGVLSRAALDVGAPLVHVSTDYVFGGEGNTPYRETAVTAPRGVYAQSKLEGERLVLETARAGGRVYVVRTSWLFGLHGANFVKTMVNLMRDRDEVRVVSDQHGRPTYTEDLAEALLALVGLGGEAAAEPGVYHFANAGETSWHGFAVAIREACLAQGLALRAERVLAVTTAEFPRPAPRPAHSVLDTAKVEAALGKPPRPWRTALEEYLRREFPNQS
ncbi:MAG: dTDP-4-dehydrorhamnose reductase [Myxococcota bacterium]|nr:dTDP-4-dehydrorhamnose reductase [Myxococcota bacterium]